MMIEIVGGFSSNILFMKYARKPQAFKPGDEWHPFGAKRRPFPACLAWLKVMTGMPEA